MLEYVASRKILTEYVEEKRAILKIYECIYYQYIDIHHTKNQTEITLSSCSILGLKSLFKYLESGMCKDGIELDNCDFTVP